MQQHAYTHSFAAVGRVALVLALTVLVISFAGAQAIAPQVAAGYDFSAALSTHGRVWTWGNNMQGQLGICLPIGGTQSFQPQGPVPGLNHIVRIAAGEGHTVVLTAAGQVMTWGNGSLWGILGQGATNTAVCPQVLPSVSSAVQVVAGSAHSLILLQNGTVLAFGYGATGALGLGTTNHAFVPTLIPGLANVVDIAAGYRHSAAVLSNGTIMVWGDNAWSQLGFVGANALVPTPVPGITGAVAVACGYQSTLALDSAGVVRHWGATGNYSGAPAQVMVLPAPASAIAAARQTLVQMALLSTGIVCTWGSECSNGTLGGGAAACGSGSQPILPVGVAPNVVAISLGATHALTVSQSGTVSSWGFNFYSQLGYTTPTSFSATPGIIPGLDMTEYALYLVPIGGFTELRWFHGAPSSTYANVCTGVAQTGPTAGLANFGGLWIPFNELLAWATFIQTGYPMATGALNAAGEAVVTLPMPNSALAGLTVNAVSFNLALGTISSISPVATHTF